jgi:hypothetical protein
MAVTWKQRSYFSDPRTGTGATSPSADLIGTKIYTSHGSRNAYSALLSSYDIATNTWTHGGVSAPDAAIARSYGAGAISLGKHYSIGGCTASGVTAAVETFDPSTSTWSTRASMPTARASLGGSSMNNKVYAIGGGTSCDVLLSGTIYNVNEVYDPPTNTWTTLAPMPIPVMGNSATVGYNGKIYVFGGWNASGLINQVQIYDVASNTWTTGVPIPTPRFCAMAGVLNGQIVVFGGSVPSSYDISGQLKTYSASNITEIYDPATNSWTIGPNMMSAFTDGGQGMTFNDTQIFAMPGSLNYVQALDAGTSSQPSIYYLTATSGVQGSSLYTFIYGNDLAGATSVVFTGTGVTAAIQAGGTSSTLPILITIDPNATTGQRQFAVNTPTGSSGLYTGFTVASVGTGTSSAAVSSSSNPSIFGNLITFTAVVTGVSPPGTPTGTVIFLDGTTLIGFGNLSGGQATMATSQLTIGSHSITVRYWGDTNYQGSTSSVLTQVINGLPPSISSISTCLGYQGTTLLATISGSNLFGASSVTFSGTGISATIGSGGTATSLPITITIAATASVGTRNITVTTPGGSYTLDAVFSVLQASPPVVQSINPESGATGTTVSVTVVGLNMLGASAVSFSGTGVTATVSSSSDSTASLNVTIASGALLGIRSMTITNAYGTSQQYTGFTVTGKKRSGQITSD